MHNNAMATANQIHQISKVQFSPFSSIRCPSERDSFLKDWVLGDGEVGVLPLDHWVPQGLHHLQLGGEGDQRPALHLSMEMKEVRRLWAKVNRCEKMQNILVLSLKLRRVYITQIDEILRNISIRKFRHSCLAKNKIYTFISGISNL